MHSMKAHKALSPVFKQHIASRNGMHAITEHHQKCWAILPNQPACGPPSSCPSCSASGGPFQQAPGARPTRRNAAQWAPCRAEMPSQQRSTPCPSPPAPSWQRLPAPRARRTVSFIHREECSTAVYRCCCDCANQAQVSARHAWG